MKEYPTLTALMAGREPGSVKVLAKGDSPDKWFRPGSPHVGGTYWHCLGFDGGTQHWCDEGPWLLVSEDQQAPAPSAVADTLRLQIAAQVLAGIALRPDGMNENRHAYALGEADALIAEARK